MCYIKFISVITICLDICLLHQLCHVRICCILINRPTVAHGYHMGIIIQRWIIICQRWPNVAPTCGANEGPTSKMTLAQRTLPTLAQRKMPTLVQRGSAIWGVTRTRNSYVCHLLYVTRSEIAEAWRMACRVRRFEIRKM